MRQEWIADPNEKELILSIEEVLASPNASKTIVQINIDYATDCKASELTGIIKMIVALFKAGKITKGDIASAMTDVIEFSDSFACDNPRIYDYVGDMFCEFANIDALTVDWLCANTAKVGDASCKPKVIAGAIKGLKKGYGDRAMQICFGGASERRALEGLLGAAKFQEIAAEFGL